ncbi:MAG: hypothetical protein R3F31_03705 [Verrucomicrobiales bacterium]
MDGNIVIGKANNLVMTSGTAGTGAYTQGAMAAATGMAHWRRDRTSRSMWWEPSRWEPVRERRPIPRSVTVGRIPHYHRSTVPLR